MIFLVDTCVAVWFFEGSDEIPEEIVDPLADDANDVLMSDVSVLEIVIRHAIGKFPLPGPPSTLLPALAREHHFEVLPLSTADIFRLERLPLLHRDPFDRLLIAQAMENGLTLVTPDPQIRRYKVRTLWA
jgi:PIN domain nuclease of toxin-antitoxin system